MNIKDTHIISLMSVPKDKAQGLKLMMNTYQEPLYWHIRRILVSHDATEDALQETFIKAYQNFHQFKKESKLYTWLYRIATNEALQELRKLNKKAEKESSDADYMQKLVAQNTIQDAEEIQKLLQKAIQTLPERQRLVFTLRYYDEMPYEDISSVLGTNVGTLKTNYHYAKQKIEQYILNKYDQITT